MSDLIHVKDSARQERPLCLFDAGINPMAWTTRTSAEVIADCAECLAEVLRDKCGICNGSGVAVRACGDEGCCGEVKCSACDLEAAEAIIAQRGKKPSASAEPRP